MVVFSSNLQVWSVSSLIKARHVFSSLMHKETCFCSRIQSNFVVVHAFKSSGILFKILRKIFFFLNTEFFNTWNNHLE